MKTKTEVDGTMLRKIGGFFALQWDASRFILDLEIDINPNCEYFKIWKDRAGIVLLLPTECSKALNLLCLQWMEMHNFHIAL